VQCDSTSKIQANFNELPGGHVAALRGTAIERAYFAAFAACATRPGRLRSRHPYLGHHSWFLLFLL